MISSGLPEKVHINEERMAAHLQELHLDNNNLQWHPDLEEQWYTQQKHKPSEPTGDRYVGQGCQKPPGDISHFLRHEQFVQIGLHNTLQYFASSQLVQEHHMTGHDISVKPSVVENQLKIHLVYGYLRIISSDPVF